MSAMHASVAVSKIGKYATPESGDSLEMIERPAGGLSFVLVDGQRSGKAAKAISNVVVRKAIGLLADGVRDGAAARAASDYLFTYRSGQVSATLNILSIDLASQTLVIVRNNPAPVYLSSQGELHRVDAPAEAVGTRRDIRPHITEVPLTAGLAAIVATDGLFHAGDRGGTRADWEAEILATMRQNPADPAAWADSLLGRAIQLDDGRPVDDISVVAAYIGAPSAEETRRLLVQVPL
jgi:hypothetical protein